MKRDCGIYKIENIIDGKMYIGGTTNLNKREKDHFNCLRKNKHKNRNLQMAFNECGEENFKFIIILYCESDKLYIYEQKFVNEYKNLNMLYNIFLDDVKSPKNVTPTNETKEKLSRNHANVKGENSGTWGLLGKNNPNYGRKNTPETIEMMRKIKMGKNNPNYGKRGENSPNYGIHPTQETKTKISITTKRNYYKRPLIFDCFLFFQELDILEIRLNELYDIVDYFIIHESRKTHSGKEKELVYEKNKDRFKKFWPKIIYRVIEDTPDNFLNLEKNDDFDELHNLVIDRVNNAYWFPKDVPSYGRDTFEKESLIRSLGYCQPQDIIILSDCDEIPRANAVKQIIEDYDDDEIFHLEEKFFWYSADIQKTDEIWYGSIITSFKRFKENSFCEMRTYKKGNFINNAGWHLSYMNGIDAIKTKIESFGEQSLNLPQIKDNIVDNVENCLTNGHDLFFRPAKFELVPIAYETHPKYLVEHQEEFKDMIKSIP